MRDVSPLRRFTALTKTPLVPRKCHDSPYPGFIELSPTRGLVSWYSSHEKDDSGKTITAIYLADLVIAG